MSPARPTSVFLKIHRIIFDEPCFRHGTVPPLETILVLLGSNDDFFQTNVGWLPIKRHPLGTGQGADLCHCYKGQPPAPYVGN